MKRVFIISFVSVLMFFPTSYEDFKLKEVEIDLLKWTERADNLCVKGTVLNHQYYAADQDWILEIQPEKEYHSYMNNRKGNFNIEKMMEAEVEPLDSEGGRENENRYFAPLVGKEVWITGTWVDDNGHESKTELHPITGIVCLDKDTLSVFAFSDDSWNLLNKVPHSGESRDFRFMLPLLKSYSKLSLLSEINKTDEREIHLQSNQLSIFIRTGEPKLQKGFYFGKWLLNN